MLSFAVLLFPAFMIFAACMDLFTMRIANRLTIAIALGFLPVAIWSGLPFWSLAPQSIALHYACGFCMLLIAFALFAFGKIGGGDAKLVAASAVWVGWADLLDYVLVACLLGGAFALFLVATRKFPLPEALLRQEWIARLHKAEGPLPFGVALGAGAVIVYPQTTIWLSAMGG